MHITAHKLLVYSIRAILALAIIIFVSCDSNEKSHNKVNNVLIENAEHSNGKQGIIVDIFIKALGDKIKVYNTVNLKDEELWMLAIYDRITSHPYGFMLILNTVSKNFICIENYICYIELLDKSIHIEYATDLVSFPLLRINDLFYSDWQFGYEYSKNEFREIIQNVLALYGRYNFGYGGFDTPIQIRNLNELDLALIIIEDKRRMFWNAEGLFEDGFERNKFREHINSYFDDRNILFFDGLFIHRIEIAEFVSGGRVFNWSPHYLIRYYLY